MEKRRETTERHRGRLLWLVLAVGVLIVWLGMEIKTIINGRVSILGLGYIFFFAGILVWRYSFRYTCILTDESLTVVSQGLGMRRTFEVKLKQTESFSNRYVRSFFRRTKISRYIYRYSSFDARPTRIFVFNENNKMQAILFKASDEFIDELIKIMPNNYLDLEVEKKR